MPRRPVALLTVAVLVAGGCLPAAPTAGDRSPPSTAAREPTVGVELVATLEQPVAMAWRVGDPALYVAEKLGRVVALLHGRVLPVLDLTREVSLGAEQGLLGLAFSPGGRFLYVDLTDTGGNTRVLEYVMRGRSADLGIRRQVLFVEQPFSNHNGGNLAFGPDGDLYIGLGDGGGAGDPLGNAQSLSSLLGKILRISPRPVDGRPYGIPADNPFVDDPGARAEIWALGLRNPWRFSFDRKTGDLWIGDVGQNAWEEIDLEPADSRGGRNFGWPLMEGNHPYGKGSVPHGAVAPVYEYPHTGGACVVTGGYRYRGEAIPGLRGAYVFADLCLGRLEAIRVRNGRPFQRWLLGPVVENLASFGEDASGELYALSLSGPVYLLVPA